MKAFLRAWWPVLVVAVVLFGGLIAFPYTVNALVAHADPAELAKQGQYGDQFGMLASALNACALLITLAVFRRQVAQEEGTRRAVDAHIKAAQDAQRNLGDQVAVTAKGLGDVAAILQTIQQASTERSAREEAALLEARLASCVTALAAAIPEIEKRIPNMTRGEQQRASKDAAKTVLAATVKDFDSGVQALREVQARIEASLAESRQ